MRVTTLKTCLDCGIDISDRAAQARRCTSCVVEREGERQREKQRRYRTTLEGKAYRVKAQLKWAAEHPEVERERQRQRGKTPAGKAAAAVRQRRYYAAHPLTPAAHIKRMEAHRQYYETPRGKDAAERGSHARRARLRGAGGLGLTRGLQTRLYAAQQGRCQGCGLRFTKKRPPHLDHMDPLARGGRNEDANVQLLCAPCNLSKHTRTHVEFALSRGRLL